MNIMMIIEPDDCWQARQLAQQRAAEAAARQRNLGQLTPIQEDLMALVRAHDEPEIHKTKLAAAFAKAAGYHHGNAPDEWIQLAWENVARLIICGKLEWGTKRHHVRLAPPEKFQAYLQKLAQQGTHLPEPQI